MSDETEKKLLNAALNVFAKKGRDAATTKAIAEKAGRTEMTLFRKFGTKKNLYEMVMLQNMEKIQKSIESIVKDLDGKYKNSDEFLEIYIQEMLVFYKDNIEAINLIINDNNSAVDDQMGDIYNYIGDFLARNIPDTELDSKTLVIYINSFIYCLSLDIYYGRNDDVIYEEKVEKFINNLKKCFRE
ncbi:MAG: TetR/AcrR family transcriptional regulator [Methanobacterium sp.]|nr:TetR/AcrR family transcriptional regulator [Methanobacterium sp.]